MPQVRRRGREGGGSGKRNPGLELFFDLVFVLCVAQLADKVHEHPTWTTTGAVLLIFVPVWWTWTSMTFAINRFPDDRDLTTALVLLAAGASGLMALAIPSMPSASNTWFAVSYLSVRLILALLYFRARSAGERLTRLYAQAFTLTAAAWLVSIFLPRTAQPFVWAAALLVDIFVPVLADRQRRILPVDQEHLPDRFGAFAIIVLGESAVNTVAVTDTPLRSSVVLLIAEGFVISGLLWWGFFDRRAWQLRYRLLSQRDDSGRSAYVMCAYLHFPLVVGIAVVGAGLQIAVEHDAGHIPDAAALLTAGGVAAYLLTLNAMTWVLRTPKTDSIAWSRTVLLVALAALAAFGRHLPSAAFLGCCIAVLLAHVLANVRRRRHTAPADTATPHTPPPSGSSGSPG